MATGRLSKLEVGDLSSEQRELLDEIWSGPRAKNGNLGLVGPFDAQVRVPNLGRAVQAVGKALRQYTTIPEGAKEVAICTVGAFYRAKFEFAAHRPAAEEAGVDSDALERLRRGEDPQLQGAEQVAYEVASALVTTHRIPRSTYENAVATFGENGVIELVTVVGFYAQVSLSLNAFEVPLMDGMTDPFPEG